MKVRELIHELEKLEQDKGIWVVYDGFTAFPPMPDTKITKADAEYMSEDGVMEGDYKIDAS